MPTENVQARYARKQGSTLKLQDMHVLTAPPLPTGHMQGSELHWRNQDPQASSLPCISSLLVTLSSNPAAPTMPAVGQQGKGQQDSGINIHCLLRREERGQWRLDLRPKATTHAP